jgi:hypothetical protein
VRGAGNRRGRAGPRAPRSAPPPFSPSPSTALLLRTSHCVLLLSARAGYINYIRFQECIVSSSALRFFSGLLLIVWMLFLLHVVETTTNDYFVTSLQLAVAILNLSPNVRVIPPPPTAPAPFPLPSHTRPPTPPPHLRWPA